MPAGEVGFQKTRHYQSILPAVVWKSDWVTPDYETWVVSISGRREILCHYGVRRLLSFLLCCDCCTLYIASHTFGTWVLISFFTGYKTPEQTDQPRWHASDAVLTRSVQLMFVPLTKQVSLYKWSSVRAMGITRRSVSTQSRLVMKEKQKSAWYSWSAKQRCCELP